jgi:hypothetical protein
MWIVTGTCGRVLQMVQWWISLAAEQLLVCEGGLLHKSDTHLHVKYVFLGKFSDGELY